MSKAKYYIASFRLRTLPLSVAGILSGTLLAYSDGFFEGKTFGLAIGTVLCLQILSNLCNELGDLQKGTDNSERLGPIRSIQSGALSLQEFKRAIATFVFLSVAFGSVLVYTAFDSLLSRDGIVMLALGAAAIIAAIKYTVGKNAYGYRGLGKGRALPYRRRAGRGQGAAEPGRIRHRHALHGSVESQQYA